MPPYKTFVLDEFVFAHAPLCDIALHSSCIEPLSLAELQAFDSSKTVLDPGQALKYGPSRGLPDLRKNISSMYPDSNITFENVLVTAGAIHANFLILDTLIESGDHVIVQHPTYLQLIEIPRRAGAEVSLWKWRQNEGNGRWTMDMTELQNMIQPNTKLIVLSTPNNPLGAIMSRGELEEVIESAKARKIPVMCDEVFRFLHHDPAVEPTPSLLELGYEKSIVTGSVSKGFALPGIRLGWVAASKGVKEMLECIAHTRDYTTITVSLVDQQIASFALSKYVREQILRRSSRICKDNIAVLEQWSAENADWARVSTAQGGGTVVLRVLDRDGQLVDDHAFALALAKEERVSAPPAGLCFGHVADGSGETELRGHVRIGIVGEKGDLEAGLGAIARLRARWIS